MPRIKAATVVEHRAAQRQALVDAAREIVLAEGTGALRFAELADRAGLARPTVYEYFKTKDDVVLAVIEAELPAWQKEISAALATAKTPRQRVETFIRTHLSLVAAGRHELPFALMSSDLGPEARSRIEQRHGEAMGMIEASLREMGISDRHAVTLIGGALAAATSAIKHSAKAKLVIESTVAFVLGGVAALLPRKSKVNRTS